ELPLRARGTKLGAPGASAPRWGARPRAYAGNGAAHRLRRDPRVGALLALRTDAALRARADGPVRALSPRHAAPERARRLRLRARDRAFPPPRVWRDARAARRILQGPRLDLGAP